MTWEYVEGKWRLLPCLITNTFVVHINRENEARSPESIWLMAVLQSTYVSQNWLILTSRSEKLKGEKALIPGCALIGQTPMTIVTDAPLKSQCQWQTNHTNHINSLKERVSRLVWIYKIQEQQLVPKQSLIWKSGATSCTAIQYLQSQSDFL